MKSKVLHTLIFAIFVGLLSTASIQSVFTQSQALNAQIEGIVSDRNNASVPNAVITVKNVETGVARAVTTDENGVYHFPLLPLGIYRVTAEAVHFKTFV